MPTTTRIYRYSDAAPIGTTNDPAAWERMAQQPENLIRLGAIPHGMYTLDAEYQDLPEDTTVYAE